MVVLQYQRRFARYPVAAASNESRLDGEGLQYQTRLVSYPAAKENDDNCLEGRSIGVALLVGSKSCLYEFTELNFLSVGSQLPPRTFNILID